MDSSLNLNAQNTSAVSVVELTNEKSDSQYASTPSNSKPNTAEERTSIRSSIIGNSGSSIIEDSIIVVNANGNLATTQIETKNNSFSDNLTKNSLGQNDNSSNDTNTFSKRKHRLRKPTLRRKVKNPLYHHNEFQKL